MGRRIFSAIKNEVEEGRRITILRMSRAKRGFLSSRSINNEVKCEFSFVADVSSETLVLQNL